MKHFRALRSSVRNAALSHRAVTIALAILLVVTGMSITSAIALHTTYHDVAVVVPQKVTHVTVGSTTRPASPETNTTVSVAKTVPTAAAPSTSKSGQKTLIISPSSFTVVAGSSPTISIQSTDGRPINMPGLMSSTGGNVLFNFAAGPAKTSWTGQMFISHTATNASYTLTVFAQDKSAAFYLGTITVTVVQPTFEMTIQSRGYDTVDDSIGYTIHLNRLYGFNEAINYISYAATEAGLGCIYDTPDSSTITIDCGQASGDRPTSGILTFQVGTQSMTKSITTSYTLPDAP